jgi:hypothetical protein
MMPPGMPLDDLAGDVEYRTDEQGVVVPRAATAFARPPSGPGVTAAVEPKLFIY